MVGRIQLLLSTGRFFWQSASDVCKFHFLFITLLVIHLSLFYQLNRRHDVSSSSLYFVKKNRSWIVAKKFICQSKYTHHNLWDLFVTSTILSFFQMLHCAWVVHLSKYTDFIDTVNFYPEFHFININYWHRFLSLILRHFMFLSLECSFQTTGSLIAFIEIVA